MPKDELKPTITTTLQKEACHREQNSPEREAVHCQTKDLCRLDDRLQLLREKMKDDLQPREVPPACGECDSIEPPHTTFRRIVINNHHINCLTEFVDDLISRYQP